MWPSKRIRSRTFHPQHTHMKKNKPVKHIGHVFRIQEIDVAKGNGAEMEGTLLLTVVVVVVIMNNADAGAGQFCRHIRSFYKPCSVQACVKWTVIDLPTAY